MTRRPIMDAGPGLNFLSLNKERLLFGVLGPLAIPEVVESEIRRKSRQDERFAAAERGQAVVILVDDRGGRDLARREAERLERLRLLRPGVGGISLISTVTVLRKAAGGDFLSSRGEVRDLYTRMRGLDDGLPPLDDTGLMDLPCWS